MQRSIFAALAAFALSLLFCLLLIPLLRKWKAGQNILSYVKEHKSKSGTPTMGGLAFVFAAIVAAALFIQTADRTAIVCMAIGAAYMAVGFLDDLMKKKHKENLGLRAWQKLSFQAFVAVFAGIFCFREGAGTLYIPFTSLSFSLGFWVLPFTVFVFLATVNAVNLTDGLDGLAAGVSLPFFAFVGGIMLLENQANADISVLCFSVAGALGAYLLFNVSPASVFMGDTGSLALGGLAASVCAFTGNALYIVVIGLPFVLSAVSVILQVVYFKATGGKRIFLMSPLHHHFQQKGYSESKIAYAYSLYALLAGAACVAALL